MSFAIKYGAWIRETTGDKTLLISMEEDDFRREVKLLMMEGLDLDEAFERIRQKIIHSLRRQ